MLCNQISVPPLTAFSLQQLANTLVPCNLIKLWMVNQNVTHDQTGSVSRPVLSLLNGHKSNGELECEDISKPTGEEARQLFECAPQWH